MAPRKRERENTNWAKNVNGFDLNTAKAERGRTDSEGPRLRALTKSVHFRSPSLCLLSHLSRRGGSVCVCFSLCVCVCVSVPDLFFLFTRIVWRPIDACATEYDHILQHTLPVSSLWFSQALSRSNWNIFILEFCQFHCFFCVLCVHAGE